MRALLWLCFALSGAAALGIEMLWMRSAGLVMGATASTAAAVLACYFAGLALGSALARSGATRPIRLYARLEFGAAAGGLWSVAVFYLLTLESSTLWLSSAGVGTRVLILAIAVLPSTICFGATLPALGQAIARAESAGKRGGLLYAINTFGGVVGAAAMGFGLPLWIGVRASYFLVAALSAAAGSGAFFVPDERTADASVDRPNNTGTSKSRTALRVIAAGSGALALGLEVLWTHVFAQVLHNSVYSFTAVLLVFLCAIAGGGALGALLLRRLKAAVVASAALLVSAAATAAGLRYFIQSTDGLAYFGMGQGLTSYLTKIIFLAALSVGPAALASGLVLPALWQAWAGSGNAARPLGDLTAANLIGGIFGALIIGFAGIPAVGIRGSFFAVAATYILLAYAAARPKSRLRQMAFGVLIVLLLANPLRVPLAHLQAGETLRALKEDASGVVTVVDTRGDLELRLDNYYLLGGSEAALNERRQGLLPLLLHPDPHRVAFIGLATGISASAGPALGMGSTTVVELVPAVAAAAREYFGSWNANLFDRAGVRLVIDDGRRFLGRPGQFDAIVSDLFVPWNPGTGNLYAKEMYEAVARRLAPDGIFCQWLPLYQLTPAGFATIARTFLSVFPDVTLWRNDFYAERPVVGLVGRLTRKQVDFDSLAARLAAMPEWSRDPLFTSPRGVVMLYAGDLRQAAALFEAAPLNTDDRPVIEFTAPRATRAPGDPVWFAGEPLARFYDTLDARPAKEADPFWRSTPEIRAARRAGTALYRYTVATAAGDQPAAAKYQEEVRALVPEIVRAGSR